jgi:maleylacetoacetate isomerase
VRLLKKEQRAETYMALNPQGLVPTLVHEGHAIGQSLAIMEYLDETFPQNPLLPTDILGRARVRQLAYAVACDIHPLNNLRVLLHLRDEYALDEDSRREWQCHWMAEGFAGIEAMLAGSDQTGSFCHGDTPTLADLCLIPQIFNARRNDLDLSPYPTLLRIEAVALAHPAFEAAHPSNQPDAQ